MKIGIGFGLLSLIAAFLIGLLSDISMKILLPASVVFGILGSMVAYYLSRYLIFREPKILKTINTEIPQSKILTEGPARCFNFNNELGKVFLTNKKLLFKSLDSNKEEVFEINDISDIKILRHWGLVGVGLMYNYKGLKVQFALDYPGDWKALIETGQEYNRQRIKSEPILVEA
ncbi:hypothetical protein [Carboxylicivirga sp. M1479]|uniref:hypothetical protein n=1 Tax=Carboxylicivirga sp. M1479 TaxID=2594476 RepID=UPI00163D7D3C|nr:hypothetical protein [Carboxylicivirga sp. M1479]